jgi:O-acetyl-ADP-ribose deacetylase (regulator of RNase III)
MPLQIVRQDITKMRVDAIVNTTNVKMVGYSGVDLAVHTIAGPELDEECASLPPLGLGRAQITGGYNLPCKYIIHTSGPVWHGGQYGESAILRSCYMESLKLAVKNGCRTVAFPLISSGVYCYPKDQVLKFAIQTITEFLFDHELTVYICVFDRESYTFSQKLFSDIKEFIDDDYVDEHGGACFDEYSDYYELYYPSSEEEDAERSAVCKSMAPMAHPCSSIAGKTLGEYVDQLDRSFQEMLLDLIDESGMTDVECYKRANVDKRIFSKIKSNKRYRPSKQTAVAFAISLQLDLDTTQELLATAGMTLSRSNKFDKIIRYFIHNGIYDIFEINEALFEFDQVLLGSV